MRNVFDWLFGTDEETITETVSFVPPESEPKPEVKPRTTVGDILTNRGLKLTHFRRDDGRIITVVYRPRRSADHNIEVSTAICNPNDKYIRKLGNAIALTRFVDGQRISLPPLPDFGYPNDYQTLDFYFG